MTITREGRTCSFCGEQGGPGSGLRLVGGLGAQVCERCVDDFHRTLHDAATWEAVSTQMPWERMSDAELLATLPMILASAEQNTGFAHEWVDMLRTRNVSWAEIGRVLGVSRQAAWERFARKTGDKHASA
ncbi:ATP-dependent Clp protease ATP-binding subunit ClpX [Nocardioides cavernae]|uniref:ATP-dependent Clp protease ATP-binding subunit ClpX n=1 Tax=Nocardioides cavernae TaxID=1921566 RepID=A0A7Y9H1I8_9ACTN|nr:hypothetical protein [Nocardioides cavernae]NYE36260.1 ATP-dependent Clp protease ATP-binding subunit ClpX [Nocardioides cavernae]